MTRPITRAERELLTAVELPPVGPITEQVVGATGDQSGNRAAAKASAMHGQRATGLDRAAEIATQRQLARQERGTTAMPAQLAQATDIRAARAAMRAESRRRKSQRA